MGRNESAFATKERDEICYTSLIPFSKQEANGDTFRLLPYDATKIGKLHVARWQCLTMDATPHRLKWALDAAAESVQPANQPAEKPTHSAPVSARAAFSAT